MDFLGWIYWDPKPEIFEVFPGWPLRWYSLFFGLGFFGGYFIVKHYIKPLFAPLTDSQIKDWAGWMTQLKNLYQKGEKLTFLNFLKRDEFDAFKRIESPREINPRLKNALIESTNLSLFDAALTSDAAVDKRQEFDQVFADTIYPLNDQLSFYMDRLLWYLALGTLIGARLGHVFFYQWDHFSSYPIDIFKTWEGGLASHGGLLGIALAIALFRLRSAKQFGFVPLWNLLDGVAIACCFTAGCIRIGNFFNQEILGTPTELPWAVVFGHPMDQTPSVPCHPVQLYEAIGYFTIFSSLYAAYRYFKWKPQTGMITGLSLISIFLFRFFVEFFKLPQDEYLDANSILQTGQWLSIPCIVVGLYLCYNRYCHTQKKE
ncbi:MAG: lgt [Chlamydiales bacterium]|jgi:prolipoprotein diacylglyceryl transferase|nr:lgt [Chlamydiales bacterium]